MIYADSAGFIRSVTDYVHASELITHLMLEKSGSTKLSVGLPAPDFLMSDFNGDLQSLSKYRGKRTSS